MSVERTFSIVKPDAVAACQTGEILAMIQKAGFKAPPGHPDATPANESLILWELFREAHRLKQGGERREKFMTELGKAESIAGELNARMKEVQANPGTGLKAAEEAFQNMTKSCASCHKAYRN